MRQILNRFDLHAAKFDSQVFVCLLILWAVVLVCAIISINSQRFSARQRRFWILTVTTVPLFGVLAYLPFSIRREDLPQIVLMRFQKDRVLKKTKKNQLPRSGTTR